MEGKFKYQWDIAMTCDGCSNAVSKIMGKIENVDSFEASWEQKTLIVTGADGLQEKIENALQKWSNASGKEVKFVSKVAAWFLYLI